MQRVMIEKVILSSPMTYIIRVIECYFIHGTKRILDIYLGAEIKIKQSVLLYSLIVGLIVYILCFF